MRRPPTIALLPMCLSAFLTACAKERPPTILTQVKIERQQIPEDLLYCATKPKPPEKPAAGNTMSKSVAWWVAQLEAWGDDCAGQVTHIRALLRPSVAAMDPVE